MDDGMGGSLLHGWWADQADLFFWGGRWEQATEDLAREFACFVISRRQSRVDLWGSININNQTKKKSQACDPSAREPR